MVLPIVVNTDRKIAIDKSKYDHGLDDGLFLTEDGSLGMKRKSGECFDLYGKELNVSRKMGYKCYVEGGIKGIGIEGQTREDWCGDKMSTHSGYGVMTITRQQVNPPTALFGSSIKHGNVINVTISHADLKRGINHDAYEIAEELFSSKKTLNKADKQKILDALAKANRDIGCNAEYALDCFNEQMEKSVTEARGEIEAFMQNQIQNIAMKAIATNVDENGLSDFNKMIAIE